MQLVNCRYGRTVSILAGMLVMHTLTGHAAGQCEAQKLLASDGSTDDIFGSCLAVDGDVAVIGAPLDDEDGLYSGSAYVFRRAGSTWVEEQKLHASDAAEGKKFGSAVDIAGHTIVVGAPGPGDPSVYVFRYDGSTWIEDDEIVWTPPPDPPFGGIHFGGSVSISSDVVVVGADSSDCSDGPWIMQDCGSAYVFRFDGSSWNQEQILTAPDAGYGHYFGFAVENFGDTVLIGAPGSDGNASTTGSVYVWRYSGSSWVHEQKVFSSDGATNQNFGWSVEADGNVAAIGARYDQDNGFEAGAAYVFRLDDSLWIEEQKLLASDGTGGEAFGYDVAILGDTVLVGAYQVSVAYLFRFADSTWGEEEKLSPTDASFNSFGVSVAMVGETALIGASLDSENGFSSGAAYVFDLAGADCNENGTCDGTDIAGGGSPDINGNGVPDECECFTDLDGTGETRFSDLLALLFEWGPCPPDEALITPDGTPYLCETDSPWASTSGTWNYFWREDFEDGALDAPGLSASAGVVNGPGPSTDSIDCDGDGVIDGSGASGFDFFVQDPGGASVTFGFDIDALGALPTRAGLVWTDGNDQAVVTFEAFDGDGALIGSFETVLGDGVHSGSTAADRFLGVEASCGISAIRMTASVGSVELDHVQYGLEPACPADFDRDCVVGFSDLLALLLAWGPCT
jgi:hypothetical protein